MASLREVAPGVLVRTSRVMQQNTTVVVDSGRALLVDPGWMPDELEALSAELRTRGLAVAAGFSTHAHHDHVLWHPGFGDAPRWASARTAALAGSARAELVAALGAAFGPELIDLVGRVRAVDAGIPGFDVELVVHDGHAPGHTALWLAEPRVLIAGDMLSDVELPLPFDPDDVDAYLAALDRLAPYAEAARVVIPGHGNVGGDAAARLAADRRYLTEMRAVGESGDARRGNPGMAEEYARLRALVGRG